MIPPNELRCGNWVQPITGPAIQVGFIKAAPATDGALYLIGATGGESFMPEQLQPIHLTSDVLEKCGFDKLESSLDIGGISIQALPGDDGICIKDGSSDFVSSKYGALYLHRLQNVVFALTGEELNVSL